MKLKHVKPLIASTLLLAAGATFANTVTLFNASPKESGIVDVKYQLAYKKDSGSQTIFGNIGRAILPSKSEQKIDVPQKDGYRLSGIVIYAANLIVNGRKQWEGIPYHLFAKKGHASIATDSNNPNGTLKFILKYNSGGHGLLQINSINGVNK